MNTKTATKTQKNTSINQTATVKSATPTKTNVFTTFPATTFKVTFNNSTPEIYDMLNNIKGNNEISKQEKQLLSNLIKVFHNSSITRTFSYIHSEN